MAQALYRDYRPKKFKDLIGQDDTVKALKNQVAFDKVGHAYIFTGIRGTGKTTFARILAKAVNCLHISDGEPCGECEICLGIDNGTVLDVTEIDAASNNGVANIRDLREETAYVPAMAKMRIYIIDEVHMLTSEAFSALLKVLEEPPKHVMFILATTEIHRVPATILSRCQRFDLKRISSKDISDLLMEIAKKAEIQLKREAADIIARLADGAMRDALSILDTCASMGEVVDEEIVRKLTGSTDTEYLFAISTSVAKNDIGEVLLQVDTLYKDSMNPATLTFELMNHYRNILMLIVGGKELLSGLPKEEVAEYVPVSALYTSAQVILILKQLKELTMLLSTAVDKRLQLEVCMIELCMGLKNASDDMIPSASTEKPVKIKNSNSTDSGITPLPSPENPAEKPKDEKVKDETPVETGEPESTSSIPSTEVYEHMNSMGIELFSEWEKVIDTMKKVDGKLFGFMMNSRAFFTNTHVLIDCGESLRKFLRENKKDIETIRSVIKQVTGKDYNIGPYEPEEEKSNVKPDDGLEDLINKASQNGIPIEIK